MSEQLNGQLNKMVIWNQLYDSWLSVSERSVQMREEVIRRHVACVHSVGKGPSMEELHAVQKLEAAAEELRSELDRFLEVLYVRSDGAPDSIATPALDPEEGKLKSFASGAIPMLNDVIPRPVIS